MAISVLAYKNFASGGYIVNLTSAWEVSAPMTNMLTPRLGQKAIAATSGAMGVEVFINSGSPTLAAKIGVIAVLNHNIISLDDPTNFSIEAYFTDNSVSTLAGETDPAAFFNTVSTQQDGTFQSHFIWVPTGAEFLTKRVYKIRVAISGYPLAICGTQNPYTDELTVEKFSVGGIWFGPTFKPENGISIDGFAQGIADRSQVVTSIGGQVWAEPEVRQRTAKVTFAGLFEREVYSRAPAQCLQQLAAYCGVSRPLLVVPTTSSDELVYTQAIYGYLSAPAAWNLVEKVDDNDVKTRLYSGGLEIVEAR